MSKESFLLVFSFLIQSSLKRVLCHSVTAQLPGEDGYSGGKVIFIDTENTLYPWNEHGTNISSAETLPCNADGNLPPIFLDLYLSDLSRPDRLRDIADRFNVDHDAVLDNVLYARAYTSTNMHYS